jgi:hypothetical protein
MLYVTNCTPFHIHAYHGVPAKSIPSGYMIIKTYQMWIFHFLYNSDIIKLDIQVLVDALQGTADLDIILKLDRDFVVDQGFEETISSIN